MSDQNSTIGTANKQNERLVNDIKSSGCRREGQQKGYIHVHDDKVTHFSKILHSWISIRVKAIAPLYIHKLQLSFEVPLQF